MASGDLPENPRPVSLAPFPAAAARRSPAGVLPLAAAAILISAFLLFSVQPMFTRMVLPVLGGAPGVWSVAMVVFQALLLAGYAYAHWLQRRFAPATGALVHLALMAAATFALPIGLTALIGPPPPGEPVAWLLGAFALSAGLPFFAVAGNGPLIQAWFARSGHRHAADPYFLYAASNLGSFAALLLYPLAIEPALGLGQQSAAWSALWAALALTIAAAAVSLARAGAGEAELRASTPASPAPRLARKVEWAAIAFVPSALLVAVTAHISADIAAAPFLWVAPLALFLLTFVITFQRRPWLKHALVLRLLPYAVAMLAAAAYGGLQFRAAATLGLHLLAFFLIAMAAHGTLVRRRPAAEHLTSFYLWMSLGGVVGGVFAALAAPVLFDTVAEYPMLLVAGLAIPYLAWRRRPRIGLREIGWGALAAAAIVVIRHLARDPSLVVPAMVAGLTALFFCVVVWRRRPLRVVGLIAVVFVAEAFLPIARAPTESVRSFFGVHRVVTTETGDFRLLLHGTTLHGAMRLRDREGRPVERPEPTTYYHPQGGLADAIRAAQQGRPAIRVGAVGLGTGSLAWYARPADSWTFFEIDPDVVEIARDPNRFRFLANAPPVAVTLGDARLTLQAVPAGSLDLLVIDAFSSDAIPVHLLTVEALRLYAAKLAPGGRLALHISNRNLELASVVAANAAEAGLTAVIRRDRDVAPAEQRTASDVVILAADPASLAGLGAGWKPLAREPGVRAWTDDYANVFAALWRRWVEGR
jgi:SAM-dependent methyltransferase